MEDSVQGVLGMKWNVEDDTIQISINQRSMSEKVTKRIVLSVVNGVYDPLGLLAPYIIRAKILLRKIWAHEPKLDWDDEFPKGIEAEWKDFIKDLQYVHNLDFTRAATPSDAVGKPMLVIFADGSGQAYGTVAYLQWKLTSRMFSTHILSAKSRIAPVKLIDTVRLELSGSTLASRLQSNILAESAMEIERVLHLIDGEIVKAMLHRESYGFNTFVGNRLGEIQKNKLPSE